MTKADITLANKPVVAFKIDRDVLDRKELSFNVI